MRAFFFFLIAGLNFTVFSATAPTENRTSVKYTRKKTESHADAQTFMMTKAIRTLVDREFRRMGIQSQEFWTVYDQKFKDFFLTIERKLRKSYADSKKSDSDLQKKISHKKIVEKRRYGNLQGALKTMQTRWSGKASRPRFSELILTAHLDREYLRQIYLNFIKKEGSGSFHRVLIEASSNLENSSWKQLGLESEAQFSQILGNSWVDWFKKNRPENIQSFSLVGPELERRLTNVMNDDLQAYKNSVESEFKNTMLIKIHLNLRPKEKQFLFADPDFKFSGGLIVQDILSREILFQKEFPVKSFELKSQEGKNTGQALVNHFYEVPMGELNALKSFIGRFSIANSATTITYDKYRSLDQVFDFIELLRNQGIKHSIYPYLESFSSQKASIVVFYQGNDRLLKKLVKRVAALGKREIPGLSSFSVKSNGEMIVRNSSPSFSK